MFAIFLFISYVCNKTYVQCIKVQKNKICHLFLISFCSFLLFPYKHVCGFLRLYSFMYTPYHLHILDTFRDAIRKQHGWCRWFPVGYTSAAPVDSFAERGWWRFAGVHRSGQPMDGDKMENATVVTLFRRQAQARAAAAAFAAGQNVNCSRPVAPVREICS